MKAVLKWSVMRGRNGKCPVLTTQPLDNGDSDMNKKMKDENFESRRTSSRLVEQGQSSPQDLSSSHDERKSNLKHFKLLRSHSNNTWWVNKVPPEVFSFFNSDFNVFLMIYFV